MGILDEYRRQNPQYKDISNNALADAMYDKFYSNIPREEFDAKVGYAQTLPRIPATPESMAGEIAQPYNPVARTPMQIRGLEDRDAMDGVGFGSDQTSPIMTDVKAGEYSDQLGGVTYGQLTDMRNQSSNMTLFGIGSQEDVGYGINPAISSSEFGRGFESGVTGLKQMVVAASTIPLSGMTTVLGERLSMYDKVDALPQGLERWQVAEALGISPMNYASSLADDYYHGDAKRRGDHRSRALRMITSNEELMRQIVALHKQYSDEMQAMTGRVPNFTDINDVNDFVDWAASSTGQAIPFLGAIAASGALGGAPAIGAAGYGLGAGDLQSSLMDEGITDRGDLALAGAIPYAALEYLGPAASAFRGVSNKVIKEVARGYFRRLGRAIPQNAVEEFINEAGQGIISDIAVGEGTGDGVTLDDETLLSWFNQGMAGAIVGGAGGVLHASVGGRNTPAAPQVTQPAAPQPPTQGAPINAPNGPQAAPNQAQPQQPQQPDVTQPPATPETAAPQQPTPQEMADGLAGAATAPASPATPEAPAQPQEPAATPEAPQQPAGDTAAKPDRSMFDAKEWQEIESIVGSGDNRNDATGRTVMYNARTGETMQMDKFAEMVADRAAPDVQDTAPNAPTAPSTPQSGESGNVGSVQPAPQEVQAPQQPVAQGADAPAQPDTAPAPLPESAAPPKESPNSAETAVDTPLPPPEQTGQENQPAPVTQKQANGALPDGLRAVRRNPDNSNEWTLLGDNADPVGTFTSTAQDGIDAQTFERMRASAATYNQNRQRGADGGPVQMQNEVLPDNSNRVPPQVAPMDRSLSQAGAYWDGMSSGQRENFLRSMNPNGKADVRERFIKMPWSEISDNVRMAITEKLPNGAFQQSEQQKPAADLDTIAKEIFQTYQDFSPQVASKLMARRGRENGLTDAQVADVTEKVKALRKQGRSTSEEFTQKSQSEPVTDREKAMAALPDGFSLIEIRRRTNDYRAIVEMDANSKREAGTGETPESAVEVAARLLEIRNPQKQGAAADPAFKAAQDSGKLQVVHVGQPEGGISKAEPRIITKAEWDKTHSDYKSVIDGQKHILELDKKSGATVLSPVDVASPYEDNSMIDARQGPHYASGQKAARDGMRRELPSYFTKQRGKNAKDWYRGYDSFKSEASPTTAEQIASEAAQADTNPTDAQKKAAPESATQVQQGGMNPDAVAGLQQPDNATDLAADQPTVSLGKRLAELMGSSAFPSTNIKLMKMAAEDFGGTIAEGKFSPKDAYEGLELAMNMWIAKKGYEPSVDKTAAKMIVVKLQEMTETLPTQTRLDGETDAFQQFSTPPSYAFAANWVANIQMGERALEPSAGNGGIAIFAKNAGAKVDVNEIAARRAPSLKALGFNRVTKENAEQIANIWAKDPSRKYDVVVMNPPFSASGIRGGNNTSATGAQHIQQALDLMKQGGRLVAIMGHTFHPGNSRVSKFFKGLDGEYTVQANIEVNGSKVYTKYGTSYDNRILVIDKMAAPEGHKTLGGRAETIPELIDMMEDIRNVANDRSTKNGTDSDPQGISSREEGRAPAEDGGQSRDGKPKRVPEPDGVGRETDGAGRHRGDDPANGQRTRAKEGREGVDGRRETNEVDGGARASGSSRAASSNRQRTTLEDAKAYEVEDVSGGFSKYRPSRVRVKNAVEHPMQLVESSAMASVNPPRPNYEIQLPEAMVKKGLLSEAQLETVVYAGAAHSEMLPSDAQNPARRKGILIGDGTGVGKTREIAGIIADNWAQGRKKHILISKDKKLIKGARRDFDNVGMNSVPINDLGSVKADGEVKKGTQGVMFATYSTIGRAAADGKKSRLDQLVDWVGPDFDGTITFDESHLAGNALAVKGKRGTTKPSATALAVVDLQNRLPNARVVYASATAATEVHNLAYANRLGMWGPGTPFPTVNSFVEQINKGGIAAMEVVARDMKQSGVYIARNLSFDGVEYAKVEHELTAGQREMYDAAAKAWQSILQNISTVIEEHTDGGGRQRGAALAQFWGTHQRFFQQVLTSMQMPTIIAAIKKDLDAGMSPVIQLVNTNEAAVKRAMSKMQEGDTFDDIDISPRDDIIQYLETSFPINQFEEYTDDSGNVRTRPAQDSKGNFIVNAQAVRIRDEMVDKLASMVLPGNPLDMIIDELGASNVAEVTGRTLRVINKGGKKVKERRSQSKALAEAHEFQAGKRKVLVFSDAGGTGMDFHADKSAKNTARRAHYVLQAGWRADKAIQGFGRTHRTNQVSAPIYKLAGTNLSGHKRFTSSIARRLDQLGALTKGQKDTGGGGMFNATDNLENEFADVAVMALFRDIYAGNVDGFTMADVDSELGIKIAGESGFNNTAVPSVPQFLNRLLNVSIDRQNMLFDRFIEHMEIAVQTAIDNNEYTAGVEEITHDGAVLEETKQAYRDPVTGATSEYRMINITRKVKTIPFAQLVSTFRNLKFKKSNETGTVYAFRPASSRTNDRGQVIPTYHRFTATDRTIIDSDKYRFQYSMVEEKEAEAAWGQQIKDAPSTRDETIHLVTGTLLPIWDRLPSRSPKIVRLKLDDGRSLLGRQIPDVELERTLENLGVDAPEINLSAPEIQKAVMDGKTILLSSGHKIVRRRVGGELRIEVITPPGDYSGPDGLRRAGFNVERIQYKNRIFAATGEAGVAPLESLMMGKRIVSVTMSKERRPKTGMIRPYGNLSDGSPVFKKFRAELDRMGLKNVELQFNPDFGVPGGITGDHFGHITITIGDTLNPKWTMAHESVHAYKHMGVFTAEEWSILEAEAKSVWMKRYYIRRRYPNLTRAEQYEEAVAEAFGEAYERRGQFHTESAVRAALGRINNFLKAVRSWAKGLGMKSPSDVFEGIMRGEFKGRKAIRDWTSQTGRLMKHQRRASDIEHTSGALHIPDRYVFDELINGNGTIFERVMAAKRAMGDRIDWGVFGTKHGKENSAFFSRVRLQDYFLPFLRANELIERETNGKVPDDLNVYDTEGLYAGRVGSRLGDIRRKYTMPIIGIIGKTRGMTMETVGDYLTAMHAKEANAHIANINHDMPDGGSGMTNAQAEAILDAVKDSPQASAYQDISVLIGKMREESIDMRVESGLISEHEASAWRNSYAHYVPLKGFAETDYADASLDINGIGRGYNVRGHETKRRLGRKSAAFNPLISAITQAEEVVVRAEKNRVGQVMYQMAKDFPTNGLWHVKKTETKPVFNEATGLVEERSVAPISLIMAQNELAVKVDGQEHRIIFDDMRLARAASRMGSARLGDIMVYLSKFSRYFSAINTMLSPTFIVKNFVRDIVTASINISSYENGGKIRKGMLKDAPKAFMGAWRGQGGKFDTEYSRYYREYDQGGGKVSFWTVDTPSVNQKRLEKLMKAKTGGVARKSLNLITPNSEINPIIGGIERINLAVDNAIRLSAYVHARKNGYSAEKAMLLAKDLTVNFNRRGESGAAMNAIWTFSNAGMQGLHIMMRALKSHKVKAIVAGMVIFGFMLDQANVYLSDDDDDGELYYDKIADYKHEMSVMLMLGLEPDSAKSAAALWMPYGYNVFPYLGNRLSQMYRGKVTGGKAFGDVAAAAFNSFVPISGGDLMATATPTILDPFIEIARNKNFLGWAIHNNYPNQRGPNSEQTAMGNPSLASQFIAQKVNAFTGGTYAESGWADFYPQDIDHIGGFLTGGVGRFFGRSSDIIANLLNGNDIEAGQVPLVRDLYLPPDQRADRRLYLDRSSMIKEAYAAAKAYYDAGDPIPERVRWVAALNDVRREAARYYRGSARTPRDRESAYYILNKAYVAAWKANTAYSSNSIFD